MPTAIDTLIANLKGNRFQSGDGPVIGDIDDFVAALQEIQSSLNTPTLFFPGFQSGVKYGAQIDPGTDGSYGPAAGTIIPSMFFVPEGTYNFTDVTLNIRTASAGSSIQLGIYNNSNGAPSTLVKDFGAISSAAVGLQSIAGINLTLTNGWYWLAALINNGTPGFSSYNPVNGFLGNTDGRAGEIAYGASGVAGGAMPDPYPVANFAQTAFPKIFLTAA